MSEYTPEKVAEALDAMRGYMRCAEIVEHSAAAYRDSNGKTWLLEFDHLRTVLDALTAVAAERDAAQRKARMIPKRLRADRDRLHKAITEAYNAWHMQTRQDAINILHAALDKEGNDDA